MISYHNIVNLEIQKIEDERCFSLLEKMFTLSESGHSTDGVTPTTRIYKCTNCNEMVYIKRLDKCPSLIIREIHDL